MADLGLTFDANSVEPSKDFAALPAGKYRAAIIKSEWKNTKKGGKYLEFVLEILDPNHKGRRVWDRLNLQNKSQTAVEIARSTLSSICRATGVMSPNDSAQLHGIPLVLGLKVKEYNGGMTNEVSGYESVESASVAPAPAPANTPAPWEQPIPSPPVVTTASPVQAQLSPAPQPAPQPPVQTVPHGGSVTPSGQLTPQPAPMTVAQFETPKPQPAPAQQVPAQAEFGSPIPGQAPVDHQPASVNEDEIPF